MSREDEEYTTFITVDDIFCYVSMPYDLNNALPTFVCEIHKTFGDLSETWYEKPSGQYLGLICDESLTC
jgi:hypothetical protein